MEKSYEKVDNKLVETVIESKETVTEHSLDELIKIRESIDISEAEYLAKSQAEKDKFDALIAECKKKGIVEQADVVKLEESVEVVSVL